MQNGGRVHFTFFVLPTEGSLGVIIPDCFLPASPRRTKYGQSIPAVVENGTVVNGQCFYTVLCARFHDGLS